METTIIWGVIDALRIRHSVFSHSIIHDGMLIDKAIHPCEVMEEFERITHRLGLSQLRLIVRTLDDAAAKHQQALGFAGQHEARPQGHLTNMELFIEPATNMLQQRSKIQLKTRAVKAFRNSSI